MRILICFILVHLSTASISQASLSAKQQRRLNMYDSLFQHAYQAANQNKVQRSFSTETEKELKNYVDKMERLAPQAYATQINAYILGRNDVNKYGKLHQAMLLNPSVLVYEQKLNYCWITQQMDLLPMVFQELESKNALTALDFHYGMDLLESVPLNGILITHGFHDTYGAIYQQVLRGKRQDVYVVSLDLLQSKQYRTNLTRTGIKLPADDFIDTAYFRSFMELNASKEIAVSMTVPAPYLKPIISNLYVCGLAFTQSLDPNFDNYFYNNYCWNEAFNAAVLSDSTEQSVYLSANYLPMMLQLRSVQLKQGILDEQLDQAIRQVAEKTGKLDLVQKLSKSD